ncbi:hypothetical protein BC332_30884 [Capsicum chinense]|nr:hypothetical protein BC332_30884 [Capsicum chinense]
MEMDCNGNGIVTAMMVAIDSGGGSDVELVDGPSIIGCESEKGLLQSVVDGLFEAIMNSDKPSKYTIKLSMVSSVILDVIVVDFNVLCGECYVYLNSSSSRKKID